jgi:hypothetical protein
MSKIAIVSMVKNESDIIELFLKINIRIADRIYIIDHSSNDGTFEISKEIQKNNPNIEIFSYSKKDFNQSQVITSIVKSIASKNIFDYIIPLDADEFIDAIDNQYFINIVQTTINKNEAGLIPWETYCPISSNFFETEAPLFNCFRKRSNEPRQFYKIILGNEYAKDCIISEGNHSALSKIYGSPHKLIGINLKHAPVRNQYQIIRKSLMGSYALALKEHRLNGEGYHWDEIAEIARNNNYSIDLSLLSQIALDYAAPKNSGANIMMDSCGIGSNEDVIKLSDFAKPSLINEYDLIVRDLIAQLKSKI